jgi:hypothetical protein
MPYVVCRMVYVICRIAVWCMMYALLPKVVTELNVVYCMCTVLYQSISVSVYQCISVSEYQCIRVSVYQSIRVCVPLYLGTSTPLTL